jgi:hypothetical protein
LKIVEWKSALSTIWTTEWKVVVDKTILLKYVKFINKITHIRNIRTKTMTNC